jgi:hypothetical protein
MAVKTNIIDNSKKICELFEDWDMYLTIYKEDLHWFFLRIWHATCVVEMNIPCELNFKSIRIAVKS